MERKHHHRRTVHLDQCDAVKRFGVMLLLAADITLWIVVNIIIDLLLKRKEKRTNNSLIEKQ